MSTTTTSLDPEATTGDEHGRRFVVGGREGRARAAAIARWTFLVIVVVILYGPLLILALFSFNDSIVIALPFKGFTLEWYREAIQNPLVRESLKNSLAVALVVTPVALILGTMAAFATTRFRYRGPRRRRGARGRPTDRAVADPGGRRVVVLLEAEGAAEPADDRGDAHRRGVPAWWPRS